jgi:predicted ATP-grasp superfamily ATP-dependent carboligase
LIAAHDGTIETIRRHRGELEQQVKIALAPEEALAVAVSKARTISLAQELGIDVPRGVIVQDMGELRPALAEVGLPAVIKPLTSWVEYGEVRQRLVSQIVVDHPEARTVAERVVAAGARFLVQQWLPGPREAVWLLYDEGRFWARFVQVAHRAFPLLGGASVVRESIPPPPDIVDFAETLVSAAGLTGYSEVEFRRDREGRPRLMEINPRLSASVELAVRAGIDFPLLLYTWAAGDRLRSAPRYRFGVRMRWFAGDLLWLAETLRSQGRPDAQPAGRALRTFVADCLRPSGYDYVALSDLRPALSASVGFLTSTLPNARRARRAEGRRRGPRPQPDRPPSPRTAPKIRRH